MSKHDMGHDDYWVRPIAGGGWSVKREGTSRSAGNFATQKEAIKRGKELAKKARRELIIVNKQGLIRSKDSYGNDPRSVKDTEH